MDFYSQSLTLSQMTTKTVLSNKFYSRIFFFVYLFCHTVLLKLMKNEKACCKLRKRFIKKMQ